MAGVEKEVTSGMLEAKEAVKKDLRTEMKDQDERSANLVIYGLEESNDPDTEKSKEEDRKKVDDVAEKIGVELTGEIKVRFRAGKKNEGPDARPRPLIVKVGDDEVRERLMKNAPRLARADGMKRVFLSPDLTWEQREEAKKEEKKMRDEADRKTEEAKNEGKEGRYVVTGPRGRRKIAWREGEVVARHETL